MMASTGADRPNSEVAPKSGVADSAIRGGTAEDKIPPVLGPNLGRPDLLARIMSPELFNLTNAGRYGFPDARSFPFANQKGQFAPSGEATGGDTPPLPTNDGDRQRVQIVPFNPAAVPPPIDEPPGMDATDSPSGAVPVDARPDDVPPVLSPDDVPPVPSLEAYAKKYS
jgi:hypothetical protein